MTDRDLSHWADGSNTQPVVDGVREVDQDPDLFADQDDDPDQEQD